MDVFLLRHGKAEKLADRDENRPLMPVGRAAISRLGDILLSMKMPFTHVYTSPYLRTRQTTDELLKSMRGEVKVSVAPTLASGTHTDHVLDILHDHQPNDRVLLVGHMPDLAEITHDLMRTDDPIAFEPGSLIGLQWDNPQSTKPKAKLILALHPSLYAEDIKKKFAV